jgi:crotonobetainyl-CoA:carnitine CoA-transferase CaiB-like acyl-CoA transferase
LGRVTSGLGQHIDLALYDCMVSMHDYAVQRYFMSEGTLVPQQTGSAQPDSTVYGVFEAKGGYLVIAAQVDDAWNRLATLIGGTALATDERFAKPVARNANYAAAMDIVRSWTLAQPSRHACLEALDAAGVPSAPVQNIDEVVKDPQMLARGMLVEQNHPVLGKVVLPNLPFRFSGCDTTIRTPAPLMGQDNRRIATSLGISAEEIDAMVNEGVLYAEEAVGDNA